MLPELAVRVIDCADRTADALAVKPTMIAFAGTFTEAGTVTAGLLLDRLTLKLPPGAAAFIVTVQASVPDPKMDPLPQESALNPAGVGAFTELRPIGLMIVAALSDLQAETLPTLTELCAAKENPDPAPFNPYPSRPDRATVRPQDNNRSRRLLQRLP